MQDLHNIINLIMTIHDRHTHKPTQCTNPSWKLSSQAILGYVKLIFKDKAWSHNASSFSKRTRMMIFNFPFSEGLM